MSTLFSSPLNREREVATAPARVDNGWTSQVDNFMIVYLVMERQSEKYYEKGS